MVMLAKGNRSQGGDGRLQTIRRVLPWGPLAARRPAWGKECITSVEVLEYPELGMEAIYMITVKDFPAFILVDDKGNDFFEGLL